MMVRTEYFGNPSKQRTAQAIHEPDGLTLVTFESGAERYYDEYDDAVDALNKAGYTDRIEDKEEVQ